MRAETSCRGGAPRTGISFRTGLPIVTLLVLLVFSVSVIQRAPSFGELASSAWRGLEIGRHSAAFITAVNNWLDEGIIAHRFAVRIYPASVENPDFETRGLYISYPPGHIISLFLLAKVFGCRVNTSLWMAHSYGVEFLIAYILCVMALYFARRSSASLIPACLISTTPAILFLLMPMPQWYYMDLYGPELFVLLPFVLVVFLELLRDNTARGTQLRTCLGCVQSLLVAWGAFTEYLFIFVVAILCLKRIATAQSGRRLVTGALDCLPLVIPLFLALGLFLLQVLSLGKLSAVFLSGRRWTGPGALYFPLLRCIVDVGWNNLLENGGILLPPLLALTVASALLGSISYWPSSAGPRREDIRQLTTVILLLLLPCLPRTAILLEHERQHGFDGLKYLQLVALAAPVLVPLLLLAIFHKSSVAAYLERHINKLFIAIFSFMVLYLLPHQLWPPELPPRNPDDRVVARFIKENTSYSDIVFSTDVVTPSPADGMYYPRPKVWRMKEFRYYSIEPLCDKRIHPVLSCKDILWHIRRGSGQDRDIVGDYNVVLFERNSGELQSYPDLTSLAALGAPPTQFENMALYRVSRAVFEDYARRTQVNLDSSQD